MSIYFLYKYMKKPLIKICWTRSYMKVLEQVDYVWYICTPWYTRSVSAEKIAKISYMTAKKVGVFVNESTEMIDTFCSSSGIHIVQLHGEETPAQCTSLKKRWYTIFKALPAENWQTYRNYEGVVDLYIFDGKDPWSWVSYDYTILQEVNVPYLVAWGISPSNAKEVLESLPSCLGVDISSGVESDGVKDEKKIQNVLSIKPYPLG